MLTGVQYPEVTFEPDPEAAASAREVFTDLRAERRAGARVADSVLDGLER